MRIDWNHYDPGFHFDELLAAPGQPRAAARGLAQYLRSLSDTDLATRKAAAELAIVEMGITFTVYSEGQNIDRVWPFDIVPRVIPALEWTHVERGLRLRLTALNHCIDDIYIEEPFRKHNDEAGERSVVRLLLTEAANPSSVLSALAGARENVRNHPGCRHPRRQPGAAPPGPAAVERLQVRLAGATDGRYLVACNGRRVPLRSTGTHGEQVAGVRYRAWNPPSALHPTIGQHAPLVLDIIDTWNGRAVGGCTYHVAHPGGRNYDTFPINAYEAEGRRIMRFWNYGHTPGALTPSPQLAGLGHLLPEGSLPAPLAPAAEAINAEYPHTLDLRWQPG